MRLKLMSRQANTAIYNSTAQGQSRLSLKVSFLCRLGEVFLTAVPSSVSPRLPSSLLIRDVSLPPGFL